MYRYGLIVLCASTYLHGCSQGLVYSMGAYFVDWSETFESAKAETAWIISISMGLLLMMGPVAGALCQQYGIQATAILGSVIAALGLVTSAYATHIYHLYITLGGLTGTGLDLMFISCLSSVGEHFTAHRTLIFGLVAVGSGMCLLAFPYLHRALIDLFTWRVALIILGGVVLQGAIMGALLRAPEGTTKTKMISDGKQSKTSSNSWWKMFTLCQDIRLLLFVCGNFFLSFGGNVLPTLIVDYAVERGSGKTEGTELLSLAGLGSFLGRLAVIPLLMASKTRDKVLYMYIAGGFLRSMGTFLLPTTSSSLILSCLALCYGMGLGIQICVGAPCIPVVFGTDNLPYYLGFFHWSLGLGAILGSPSAGWLINLVDYAACWFICGAISLLSGLFYVAVLCVPAPKDLSLDLKPGKNDIDCVDAVSKA